MTDPTTKPQRAALYLRVSSERQVAEGRSLDSQREDMQRLCQQKGWEIVKIYHDDGLSGRLKDRPGLQNLLHDAQIGKFDTVVVYYVSRLHRKVEHFLSTMNFFKKIGVNFISYHEHIDSTSSWGKLTLNILATLAEIYVDNLSETTSRGKKQRASAGLYNGSIPFGYCTGHCHTCTDPNGEGYCPLFGHAPRGDGKIVVPHPIESAAVKLAFEWYSTGNFSDADIAYKLNHHSFELDGKTFTFRPKRKKGDHKRFTRPQAFTNDTARDMLRRAFYTGVIEYRGGKGVAEERRKFAKPQAVYTGKHEPLVSMALFDKVQLVRRQRGRSAVNARSGRTRRVYPLSGLLYSYPMRNKMTAVANGAGKRYYRDRENIGKSKLDRDSRSPQPIVLAEPLEAEVQQVLNTLRLSDDWKMQIRAYLVAAEYGMVEIERRRRDLNARFDRLRTAYLDGNLNHSDFERRKAEIDKELATLLSPAHLDNDRVSHWLEHPEELWQHMTPAEQKSLFAAVFDRVYVKNDHIVRLIPHPPFFAQLTDTEDRLVLPRDDVDASHLTLATV